MDATAALKEWRQLLGEGRVLDPSAAALAYGVDTGGSERRLAGALKPATADVIPEILRIAQRHGQPVYPFSTGRNWGYGTALPVRQDCVLLDLGDLQAIDFDPELGVVTLEPGVTQGMLAQYLDAGNHPFLVPVTGAGPECSLVGNVLERGYGVTPFVDHFGAVTDLEAVLADGTIYRTALREAGGEALARLFKWGLGPYSAGLFTQSNFGIVTRMSIALARRPECVKVCLFSLKDDALLERAITAIRNILARLPGTVGAINLMNQHRVLAMSAPFPADELDARGMIPEGVIQRLGRQYQIFPRTGFGTLYGTGGGGGGCRAARDPPRTVRHRQPADVPQPRADRRAGEPGEIAARCLWPTPGRHGGHPCQVARTGGGPAELHGHAAHLLAQCASARPGSARSGPRWLRPALVCPAGADAAQHRARLRGHGRSRRPPARRRTADHLHQRE